MASDESLQDRVRELEQTLATLGTAARVAHWRRDIQSGEQEWSAGAAMLFGWPDEGATASLGPDPHIEPLDLNRVLAARSQAVAVGQRYSVSYRIRCADGSLVAVFEEGRVIRPANRLLLIGVLSAAPDIAAAGRTPVAKLSTDGARPESSVRNSHLLSLEAVSDGYCILDSNFHFVFANAQAIRILQRTKDEIVGRLAWSVFPPDAAADVERFARLVNAQQKSASFRVQFPQLNAWFQVNVNPTLGGGLALYFQDISVQHEQEVTLGLLLEALDHQDDSLMITEATANGGYQIAYVNAALERQTGLSRDYLLGLSPRSIPGIGHLAGQIEEITNALAAGRSAHGELLHSKPTGEPYWIELEVVPLFKRGQRPSHLITFGHDITGRREQQARLEKSEERFRIIANAMADVVWDWDIAADLIWWSDSAEKMFGEGWHGEPRRSECFFRSIVPEDSERVAGDLRRLIRDAGANWSGEFSMRKGDGKLAEVTASAYAVFDASHNVVRLVGNLVDVTERRQIDRVLAQTQKLEALGKLTGGVAHDFNNLLTVIVGNAEVLAEELEDVADLRDLAEITLAAAARGAELSHRLLAFARSQSLEPRNVDINALLRGMQGLIQRTLNENLELDYILDPELRNVLVDPGQLETAILNLVLNARDAMPHGGRLTIETETVHLGAAELVDTPGVEAGDYVGISVSDTGEGMSDEVKARAFEPFFTTKEPGKGNGLGLSMMFGFVAQSRGHMAITSALGVGTTMRLYLPHSQLASEEPHPAPAAPEIVGGSEHILYVEDDEVVRTHVCRLLVDLGYQVTTARTGAEAFELIQRNPGFDLLFADVGLPKGLNGRQLAEASLALYPDLKVLFTSGYDSGSVNENRPAALGSLLVKPFRLHELSAAVRRTLDA